MSEGEDELMLLGRISGIFGVRGWVKVYSYTSPRDNILKYSPWQLHIGEQSRSMTADDGHLQGKGVVAHLKGCDDREAARALIGAEILIRRTQLPATAEDEFYWSDLEGLKVVTVDGVELGTVDYLHETGANDVLVVKGKQEYLIPYIRDDVVVAIDLVQGIIQVDWDPEF